MFAPVRGCRFSRGPCIEKDIERERENGKRRGLKQEDRRTANNSMDVERRKGGGRRFSDSGLGHLEMKTMRERPATAAAAAAHDEIFLRWPNMCQQPSATLVGGGRGRGGSQPSRGSCVASAIPSPPPSFSRFFVGCCRRCLTCASQSFSQYGRSVNIPNQFPLSRDESWDGRSRCRHKSHLG